MLRSLFQEGIQQSRAFGLGAGHQMPVEVERHRDRRMAHEGRQGLGVDAGRDHERGVAVSGLVEAQAVGEASFVPAVIGVAV